MRCFCKHLRTIILITVFIGCDSPSTKLVDNILTDKLNKVIKLNHNFDIQADRGENFGDYTTYTSFRLFHNGINIFIDTSLTEYEFGNNLFPIENIIDNENFEILVEINNRPNKNYLNYFRIKNDSIIEIKRLPTFITKASNLDNDNNLEYAGFWDYSQIWGGNDDSTAYNPIIYYEIKDNGIILDSSLTIEKNKAIYGKFKGFSFDERDPVSFKETSERFNEEIKRIENSSK